MSNKGGKFEVGDLVYVNDSKLKSYGRKGVVEDKYMDGVFLHYKVRFDSTECYIYNEKSLDFNLTPQGFSAYMCKNEPQIAQVRFFSSYGGLSKTAYSYKLEDSSINKGDCVICYTSLGLRVGIVDSITDISTAYETFPHRLSKSILGKITLTKSGLQTYTY